MESVSNFRHFFEFFVPLFCPNNITCLFSQMFFSHAWRLWTSQWAPPGSRAQWRQQFLSMEHTLSGALAESWPKRMPNGPDGPKTNLSLPLNSCGFESFWDVKNPSAEHKGGQNGCQSGCQQTLVGANGQQRMVRHFSVVSGCSRIFNFWAHICIEMQQGATQCTHSRWLLHSLWKRRFVVLEQTWQGLWPLFPPWMLPPLLWLVSQRSNLFPPLWLVTSPRTYQPLLTYGGGEVPWPLWPNLQSLNISPWCYWGSPQRNKTKSQKVNLEHGSNNIKYVHLLCSRPFSPLSGNQRWIFLWSGGFFLSIYNLITFDERQVSHRMYRRKWQNVEKIAA